jgi:bifunctional ADP-heptose synthase (sugar kinase/adenylyltransferase)
MKILVVGDIMLDKYITGKVNRLSPEAPVPIVNVQSENYILGGSANVANNLAKIEVETHIVGIVGNDQNGQIVKNLLYKNKSSGCCWNSTIS